MEMSSVVPLLWQKTQGKASQEHLLSPVLHITTWLLRSPVAVLPSCVGLLEGVGARLGIAALRDRQSQGCNPGK
jgi:hypothetical protein